MTNVYAFQRVAWLHDPNRITSLGGEGGSCGLDDVTSQRLEVGWH